jgi:hypothetical protein
MNPKAWLYADGAIETITIAAMVANSTALMVGAPYIVSIQMLEPVLRAGFERSP